MEITWEQIIIFANFVIGLIVAFGGIVPIVNKIKHTFNLKPRYSQFVTVLVVFLYTVLSMVVQGVLVPESLTMAQFGTTFVAVLTASQAEYNRVKRGEAKNTES